MGQKITALFFAIWLGTQLCGGYVVAPVLFQSLPKMTAGSIAGQIFHVVSYFGIIAFVALLLSLKSIHKNAYFKQARVRLALLALILIVINEFMVTPVIEALKTNQAHVLINLISDSFGMWHGVSSLIFLMISFLGIILALMIYTLQLGQRRW